MIHRNSLRALFAAVALVWAALPSTVGAQAQTIAHARISIEGPWAAATPGGARVAAGYVTLRNPNTQSDRLIAVASPRARRVELHEMRMDGAVMRMRQIEAVDVPARGEVALAPGGYHIMFIDVDRPFVDGESVSVTLTFERGGAIEVEFPIRRRRGGDQ